MDAKFDKNTFSSLYSGQAPWDTGRPQPAFVDAAESITGDILDCGCGTGETALFFARRGGNVTGFDYLEGPVAQAQQKAAAQGLAVRFLVMDALTLKDFPQRFDNIIDFGLFHFFPDLDRKTYVAGLAAVLRPGGRLFLLCFSNEEPGTHGPRRISKHDLYEAFAHGWVIESIEPSRIEFVPNPRGIVCSDGGPRAWFAVIRRT